MLRDSGPVVCALSGSDAMIAGHGDRLHHKTHFVRKAGLGVEVAGDVKGPQRPNEQTDHRGHFRASARRSGKKQRARHCSARSREMNCTVFLPLLTHLLMP